MGEIRKNHLLQKLIAFTLGVVVSVAVGQLFLSNNTIDEQRILYIPNIADLKLHLLEFKFDVLSGQGEVDSQRDFELMMDVLEKSHDVTGEGLLARDRAVQAAATGIGDAISNGTDALLIAIENMMNELEQKLHAF